MNIAGHVFVTRGDLTKINCDAWLLPTDYWLDVVDHWLADPKVAEVVGRACNGYPRGFAQIGGNVLRVVDSADAWDAPVPYLVDVAPRWLDEDENWYIRGISSFFDGVAADRDVGLLFRPLGQVHGVEETERSFRSGRERPLVALPVVGTGAGGAGKLRGHVIKDLLSLLYQCASKTGLDIVLVTRDEASFAAAQKERKAIPDGSVAAFSGMLADPDEYGVGEGIIIDHAKRLARQALEGNLVLFIGSGVSVAAGLPNWERLLDQLHAATAGKGEPIDLESLRKLPLPDQAQIIKRYLPTEFDQIITQRVQTDHYSLAHSLLACLPVREVVTTNYDNLFECASENAGRAVAVLPGSSVSAESRWLLKLHGSVGDDPSDVKPGFILTRDDYLGYSDRWSALSGLVHAMLMTRHMLFVGFSLRDDNFIRIAYDVRKIVRHEHETSPSRQFGSALFLNRDLLMEALWGDDVNCIAMADKADTKTSARRLEIFLDFVCLEATQSYAYLLDDRYSGILSPEEQLARDCLRKLVAVQRPKTPVWDQVDQLLSRFGNPGSQPKT